MRIVPEVNSKNSPKISAEKKEALDKITRKVAIYFTLAIVVFFFFKMLIP